MSEKKRERERERERDGEKRDLVWEPSLLAGLKCEIYSPLT